MSYNLLNKSGEIVNKCNAKTTDEAISYFSKCKNISEEDLLKIYKVVWI
jgi:hypothetical protein